MNIRPARRLIGWLLRRASFGGIILPWAIYVLPERMDDHALIAHERVHEAQMARLGVVQFYAVYLWQWLRYGYLAMPLERQARGER